MTMIRNQFPLVKRRMPALGGYEDERTAGRCSRPHLVTGLMKDRFELRMICAPTGFGKTFALREYAEVVFDDEDIVWVDCTKPVFLKALDEGSFASVQSICSTIKGLSIGFPDRTRLFIFDDLGHLDEARLKAFSQGIDALIEADQEVIVAATPANDCLHSLQKARVLLASSDMVVALDEYQDTFMDDEGTFDEGVYDRTLGIPSLVWGQIASSPANLLRGFFSEGLPREFALPSAVMLLLQSGGYDEMRDLGLPISEEFRGLICDQYPLLGLEVVSGRFETIHAAVEDIVAEAADEFIYWDANDGLLEKVAHLLADRGDVQRAAELIARTCPVERVPAVLTWFGWETMEREQHRVVIEMIELLGAGALRDGGEIALMEAWCQYLLGHWHIAALHLSKVDSGIAHGRARFGYLILSHLVACDDSLKQMDTVCSRGCMDDLAKEVGRCGMCCLDRTAADGEAPDTAGGEVAGGSDASSHGPIGVCPSLSCEGVYEWTACCGWTLFVRSILAFTEEGRAASGIEATFDEVCSLVGLLEKASDKPIGFGYRMSLHMVFSYLHGAFMQGCADERIPDIRSRLERLLTRCVVPMLTKDVASRSEALVINDFRRCEGIGGPLISGESHPEGVVGRSERMLRANQENMRYLQGIMPSLAVTPFDSSGHAVNQHPTGIETVPEVCPHGIPGAAPHFSDNLADGSVQIYGETVDMDVIEQIPATLHIRFFGGFEACFEGCASEAKVWAHRNVRYLFALLALAKGNEMSRDAIMDRLWPDTGSIRARDNLYTVWKHLRSACDREKGQIPYITRTDTYCRLERSCVQTDIFEFDMLLRDLVRIPLGDARLLKGSMRIEDLYRGDLLGGDYLDGTVDGERARYQAKFTEAMLRAARCAGVMGDEGSEIWFAQQAFVRGCRSEDVYLCMMQAYAGQKDWLRVVEMGNDCGEFLKEEQGLGFSPVTSALFDEAVYQLRHCRRKAGNRSGSQPHEERQREGYPHNAKSSPRPVLQTT